MLIYMYICIYIRIKRANKKFIIDVIGITVFILIFLFENFALHRNHDFNNNSKHIRLIIWIITRQRNFILNVQDLCIKLFKRKTQKEVTSFSCEIWCCLIIPFIRHMLSFYKFTPLATSNVSKEF